MENSVKMAEVSRSDLTGSRIRERRMARRVAQGALAQAVGISPSYLNLIEHNHRRIGGKLLLDIARELKVDPTLLTEGAEASLSEVMQAAAKQDIADNVPETDRIDELAARFPGWTSLIAAQERKVEALETRIEALRDRLTHDTGLSEAMHEVLSSVAAIRSTADILVREAELDPAWRGRFHRNIHEEAERLSDRATGLLKRFELPAEGNVDAGQQSLEAVEAFFDLNDHHFPSLEADGRAAIPALLETGAGLDNPEARALAIAWLENYAADAARLPLDEFLATVEAANFDPAGVAAEAGADVALVLRRMSNLPPIPDRAPFGLAVADATGALLFRRRVPGFTMARVGARCPRWPLYRAFARPGQAETAILEAPGRVRMRAWAVAQVEETIGFGEAPILHSTMLVQVFGPEAPLDAPALLVGPDCPSCRKSPHVPRS